MVTRFENSYLKNGYACLPVKLIRVVDTIRGYAINGYIALGLTYDYYRVRIQKNAGVSLS